MKNPSSQITATISPRSSPIVAIAAMARKERAIRMPIMISPSTRNAPILWPISASFRLRSTPSGVISERLLAASKLRAASDIGAPRQIEIGEPQSEHGQPDRIAQHVADDDLPPDALEQSGAGKHRHHPRHRQRGGPPGPRRRVHPGLLAGEDHRPADLEPG